MVLDDILRVMGAPGGPGGHQGAPLGFREVWGTLGSKKSDKLAFLT